MPECNATPVPVPRLSLTRKHINDRFNSPTHTAIQRTAIAQNPSPVSRHAGLEMCGAYMYFTGGVGVRESAVRYSF